MFVILLKFSDNFGQAKSYMTKHNEWIQRGFDDAIFLLAGSIKPKNGGAILAYNTTMPELQKRVNEDPFVVEDIVSAEILEISPGKTEQRLQFLNQ